jgi:hypothetical protein
MKLLNILKEYSNQGPTSPEVYLFDTTRDEITKTTIKKVQTIPNLIYDMGGGETSYYGQYNIVIIDNMDEGDVFETINDMTSTPQKIYIKYNLENPYSFPKADKIIASQVVYHLKNVEGFANTINNSLKPNGVVEFNSDIIAPQDKKFLQFLKELGFHTHNFKEQNQGGVLLLKKSNPSKQIVTPFDKGYKKPKRKYQFQGYDGEVHTFKNYKGLKNHFIEYAENLFSKYPYIYTQDYNFGEPTGDFIKHRIEDYDPWREEWGNSLEILTYHMKSAYDKDHKPFNIFRNYKISHDLDH